MGYVAGCNDAGTGLKGLLEVNQSKLSDVKDNLLWLHFSGWGGKLTEGELAVVENREPVCETCDNSRVIDKCDWPGEHANRYQELCPDCMLTVLEPDTMCGQDGRKYCASKATLEATEELLAARNDKLEAVESLLGKFVGNHDDDGYSLQWWCKDRSLILTRDAEGKWTYLQSWEDGDEVGTCDGDMDGFSVIFGLLLWLHGGNTIPKVEK